MKVSFLGGARTVTGSMHLVETARSRILLECGLFQGHREEAELINRSVPAQAVAADFMILSHAHVDHCGNIPNLVKSGFNHEIYQTPASRDLTELLLEDAAHIQEADTKFVNKKLANAGLPPKEPLYTVEDATASLKYLAGLPYEQRFERGDAAFTLYDAGHVLGSAEVLIESGGRKLAFSGDLGRKNLPIIRDPVQLKQADFVIMESTYGGRFHPPFTDAMARLAEVVNRVSARGGRIVVPAFALERTQELVYALHLLIEDRKIPGLPVFVDSPLASRITGVFRKHPECFDEETRALMAAHDDVLVFSHLRFVETQSESMALNELRSPCIIISASGMAENGRILHHLAHSISDPKNLVLIVGFAAEHTLARSLSEKRPVVRIFGDEYALRAEVEVIDAFSAHADQAGLVEYVAGFDRSRLKKVFLVHGELSQAEALQKVLLAKGYDVMVPEKGSAVEL